MALIQNKLRKSLKSEQKQDYSDSEIDDEYFENEQQILQQEANQKQQELYQGIDDSDVQSVKQLSYQESSENVSQSQNEEEFLEQIDDLFFDKLNGLIWQLKTKKESVARNILSEMLCLLNYFLLRESKHEMLHSHPVMEYIKNFELQNQKEANQETQSEEESIKEILQEEEQPALITKRMFENKGLLKQRSQYKQEQNPRLKQKRRFQKAQMTQISWGHRKVNKDQYKKYQGEKQGVKEGLNRAVNL